MVDVAPRAIDALLDAINTKQPDLARDLTIALARSIPRCPACGAMQFTVEQFTWNTQTYDAVADEWGLSNYVYESEYPLAAKCADCETDCTALAVRTRITAFYHEPDWSRYERQEEVARG